MTNRNKVSRKFLALNNDTNNTFALEVKETQGLQSNFRDSYMVKIGFNDPIINRVKV